MSQPNGGSKPLMPTPMKGKPIAPPTPWERSKGKVYAIVLILVIIGAAGLSAAAYNHAFDGSVPFTLRADRAGLQMHTGNRVKIRGVDLGRVSAVKLSDDQKSVEITIAAQPDLLKEIPDNATVSLEQLTAFGNKAVQVNFPAQPSGSYLHSGSVIAASHVSTEINSTFDEFMTLLTEIKPSKLNAVLGGLANTFQGNGDQLGVDITEANAYLKKFNPLLPTVQRDFHSTAGFANVYAGAGNSIADTISNAGVIAKTFADKRDDFQGVLKKFQRAGNEIDDFFGTNADPLVKTLKSLRPTTSLLNEYAPELTCFIDGAAVTYDRIDGKLFDESGAQFDVNFFEPGSAQQYHYPTDLPETGPGPEKGPNCRGLPVVTNKEDSLADYTTDPSSLRQRTTDNSPRAATTPGEALPGGLSSTYATQFTAMTPLQKFFGPSAGLPGNASLRKAGK